MPNGRLSVVCTYPTTHESIAFQALHWLMRYSNGERVTGNILRNQDGSNVKLIAEGPYPIMRDFHKKVRECQRFFEPSVDSRIYRT